MSVAQILEEVKSLSLPEIELLERQLRLQRLQRAGQIASPEEQRLLGIINQPMRHVEQFIKLSQKWENEGLSDEERAELLTIVSERETQIAERAEAVQQWSALKGIPFETAWKQFMGEAPLTLVPRN